MKSQDNKVHGPHMALKAGMLALLWSIIVAGPSTSPAQIYTKVPRLSSADAATYAAHDLIYALQHLQLAGPFAPTDPTIETLKKLAEIFAVTPPLTETAAAPRVEVPTADPPTNNHHYNTRSQSQPPIAAAIIPSSHDTVNIIIDPSSGTVCESLAPLESADPETIPISSEFAASVIDPTTGQAMAILHLFHDLPHKSHGHTQWAYQ
jgi:hypothetical protein